MAGPVMKLFGGGDAPPPPKPPPPPPTVDQARLRQEASDAAARKKGARASIFTDMGVGDSPIEKKTLVGS